MLNQLIKKLFERLPKMCPKNAEKSINLTSDFIKEHSILSAEKLEVVLSKVSEILDKESKLIEIEQSKCYFLGDTHGDFSVTLHAFKHLFPVTESIHTKFDKLVFLGDFIDRGPYSIENVNFLMSMKALFPDRVVLIRGNHETREINIRFDFYENVLRRYGMKIFDRYNQIFAKLPLAIITWNKIFAVHGGLPENLQKLSDLNGLDDEVNPEDRITFQILWNDPVEKDGWFFKNFRGKYSKKFGRAAFEHFMKKNEIKLVLRAHELQKKGFKEYFGAHLISLDSSQKKRGKYLKVFIIERDGTYKVAETEEFDKSIINLL